MKEINNYNENNLIKYFLNRRFHNFVDMKSNRILIFSVITLFFLTITTANAQVEFKELSWKKLFKQAKKENKLVFVDAYTDWCGWCKVMDKKTFSQPEVGAFMNERFVNTKIEMEQMEIGRQLSMKYGISGFPSFLIFNSDGKLVSVLSGYSAPKKFIEELTEAIKPENFLNQPAYTNGFKQKYPQIYVDAYAEKGKRKFPDSLTFSNYMNTQTDFSNEVSWRVVNRFSFLLTTEQLTKITAQKESIIKNFGKSEFENLIRGVANTKIYKAIKDKDQAILGEVELLINKNLEEPWKTLPFYQLAYYKGVDNWVITASLIDNLLAESEQNLNIEFINNYAWDIYEKCDNQNVISRAIGWMKPFMDDDTEYAYLDTYAALLYKNGQLDEAEIWANKAIEVGKANGDNVEETEALLEKILNEEVLED